MQDVDDVDSVLGVPGHAVEAMGDHDMDFPVPDLGDQLFEDGAFEECCRFHLYEDVFGREMVSAVPDQFFAGFGLGFEGGSLRSLLGCAAPDVYDGYLLIGFRRAVVRHVLQVHVFSMPSLNFRMAF